jgi:2-C-methyl-D-erythritol 4-phosphate cytidylyltransferase
VPQFAVILPAAGRSSRFGDQRGKKPFIDLGARPVWLWSAEAFRQRDDVRQIIIVVSADDRAWFEATFEEELRSIEGLQVVTGGAERVDSVAGGLETVGDEIDFVAVHDAARPLISAEVIAAVFAAAIGQGAAIPAIPISSTVKRVRDDAIVETVDRSELWLAQTPQVCRRDWLIEAFAKRGDRQFTDEAQMLEAIDKPVAVVEGSPANLKITTADDLRVAAALLPRH